MKSLLSLLCSCERTNFKQTDKLNKNSNNEEDELKTIDFIESRQQDFSPKITWKHLWTFNEAENALLKSPFINMPTEMMLKIFELLSVRDLENVSLVCRYFKMIVDHDIIWKTRCNTYKQIYIDWMFEKYLRNQELKILEKQYRKMNIGFGLKYSSSRYFVPSKNNESFSPIFGFNRHPNSSSDIFQCLIPIYSYWDKTYFKFSSYPLNDYENPFSFTEADIILDANFL
ncbi:unnamed protein product [Rotaria sordida]|uniref:F-box domain-containing protein n=1 Tax=Rotaria sordida TaxID=392033 RepID=A0A815ZHL8_9BILA|nr:unnamed protein product [Rotaria sordida]CAF1582590.1 unnamed protein product [Rotaria sordida]